MQFLLMVIGGALLAVYAILWMRGRDPYWPKPAPLILVFLAIACFIAALAWPTPERQQSAENLRDLFASQPTPALPDLPDIPKLDFQFLGELAQRVDTSFVDELYRQQGTPDYLTGLLDERNVPSTTGTAPAPVPIEAAQQYLNVTFDDGLLTGQQEEIRTKTAQALQYVMSVTGITPNGVVTAHYGWADGCGLNGLAYTADRVVNTYGCNETPVNSMLLIMSHELVHQLAHDRYSNHLNADMILAEGFATWGAGNYWLSGHPNFKSFVRASYNEPLYLSNPYGNIPAMNKSYYQWASFIEFLLETYGRDKLDQLYNSGTGWAPGTADYAGILGKDLNTLAADWYQWLNA